MSSSWIGRCAGLAAWLAAGCVLESLETPAAPVASVEPSRFVVAAGYRTLAADWFWLETNLAWERHDAGETRRLIRLTLAADPASRYYRVNAARTLAYDLPAWACESDSNAPETVRRRYRELAVDEALALLAQGTRGGPPRADFEIEMANICLYALGDEARAVKYYEQAAACPDAPPYAARIAARLREQTGR